jgi:hypothetical protein
LKGGVCRDEFTNPWVKTGSKVNVPHQQLEYKAQVTYTLLTTEGRTFQGSSYDWMDDVIVNEGQDQAQAIDTTGLFDTNS